MGVVDTVGHIAQTPIAIMGLWTRSGYVSLTLKHEPPQVNSGLSGATMALLTNEVSSVLLTAKRGIIFGMSGSQEKCYHSTWIIDTLQMFYMLFLQSYVCQPNSQTKLSNFNSLKPVIKKRQFNAVFTVLQNGFLHVFVCNF